MSPSPDGTTDRPAWPDDDGFSLIEVIVALGIISAVLVALLPQLIVGIKATKTGQLVTQAKGVGQGELERMRNLPFHISPSAGDYRDVLDFYFRNLVPPSLSPGCLTAGQYSAPQLGWTGYVTGGSARCDYEPATGPFYRYVVPGPSSAFAVVVSTQFLSGTTPPAPLAPMVGYDTQNSVTPAKSSPTSSQLGVTVTVLYADRGTQRPVTTYTQLAEQPVANTRLRATADATALEVGSVTSAGVPVSFEAGLLGLSGSLTYASIANATLAATSAELATGEQGSGTAAIRTAPPATVSGTSVAAPGGLGGGCGAATLVCWGATRLDLPVLTSEAGLPNLGTSTAPLQALLTSAENGGLSFHNSAAADYRPSLQLSGPLLRMDPSAVPAASGVTGDCQPGATGVSAFVAASGFVRSTAGGDTVSPLSVESCARSRASTISLFPTTFAPRGVVLVELVKAGARCSVAGPAHAASTAYDYRVIVRYRNASGTYVTAADITPGLTADPLDALPMATDVGGGKSLGDYVASWSSVLTSGIDTEQSHGVATVGVPGVLTLTSQPLRAGSQQVTTAPSAPPTPSGTPVPTASPSGAPTVTPSAPSTPTVTTTPTPTTEGVDPGSALSLGFGAVSCSAQDAR